MARIPAAITEKAGDLQTATTILRERVEADERAIVDEAVRMMAEKQSRIGIGIGRPRTKASTVLSWIHEMEVLVCLALLVASAVLWKLSINPAATSIKNL